MNVEERKQQARSFEQQGEVVNALEIYEELLSELEGTPEIWRELPLYVKAGDLSLKMEKASAAISHYEKAARAYAAYGSSKSVIALCTKILRVNPGRTHVFLRLVRLMIEREHLAEARLVLFEYSERMKLPKAGIVLEDLADCPDEQLKPLLEMLLELGGRYEYARAQGRGQPTETGTDEEEPELEKDSAVEEPAETTESSAEEAQGVSTGDRLEPEPEEDTEQTEQEEESEQAADVPSTPAAPSGGSEIQWVDGTPSMRASSARASRKVLFREMEQRKKPKALWIGLGVVAVVVVGGLSLVLFNVIPLGGGGSGAGVALPETVSAAALSDSALMAGADLDDTTSSDGDTVTDEIADSTVAGQDSVTVGAADSTLRTQPEMPTEAPVEQPSPESPPSRGVLVQDLSVESSTEFVADGRVGYRVTQVLPSGELLTLTAIYYGDEIASAPGTEELMLAPLVGDTTTATMHFNGYAVEVRAVVSASELQSLLDRLMEAPPSN